MSGGTQISELGTARAHSRPGTISASTSRSILLLAVAGAAAAGLSAIGTDGSVSAVAAAGPDLTRLLRAMAGLKMLMAAGVATAVLWRLHAGITPAWLAAYTVACAAMAAGPGLIWTLVSVGTGAVLLHGGLLVCILLLWRDPAVVARLAALVEARRAARRQPGRV